MANHNWACAWEAAAQTPNSADPKQPTLDPLLVTDGPANILSNLT